MRKTLLVLIGVLLLIIAAVAWYIKANLVKEPYNHYQRSEEQLINKDYLAAQTILTKLGSSVSVLTNWRSFASKAEDKNQLLMIFEQNLRLQKSHDDLLNWVNQGNHLFITMEKGYLGTDSFSFFDDDELDDKTAKELSQSSLTDKLGIQAVTMQQSDETPSKKSSNPFMRLRKAGVAKQLLQKKLKDLDQQKPKALCVQSMKARLNAQMKIDPDFTIKPKQVWAKQTISELKKQTTDENTTSKEPRKITEERENLINCSINLTQIRLPEHFDLSLLLNRYGTPASALLNHSKYPTIFEGKNALGTQIVRLAYGKGSITVLPQTAAGAFKNPEAPNLDQNSIAQFDHAMLLAYLSQGKSKVLILDKALDFFPKQSPSILKWLLNDAPELFVCIILFILLFIWQHMYRQGPILAELNLARRQLKDHFHAQGEFLRRHAGLNAIIEQLRDDIWAKLQKRIPNIRAMSTDTQREEITRLTHLHPSELWALMMPLPEKFNPFDLIKYVVALQKIRNKL
ncbi:hypothetical protein [Neisseria sp. Ec49-e6-T10]|uniref:hypothetical protein n=1 Tax=Neisseria sp. Ec49-e6-T10 TaxID=3140744 RepID=UPI003EBD9503